MPRKKRETPWLEQRDNGVFYAFWYDAENRRTRKCSLHTTDADTARTAFGQFLLNGKTIYDDGSDGLTVEACLESYLREHAAVKCADPSRQHDAAVHLKAFFADTLISDIDIPMSRAYAEARRSGEVGGGRRRANKAGSDSTIRRELNVLIAAANHAERWKRLTAAELPKVELPTVDDRRVAWLTREEVIRLFEESDGHLHRFIRIAYWTAGRKNSVQRLRLGQLNFEMGRIDLMPEGGRRTVKRKPIVPLYDELKPDLRWLIERLEDGDDRLFGRQDFYRPFRQLCKRLGFEDRSNPHILRHSRATHLLVKGVSIYDVAKLLGDTVSTVERTYGHHSSEFLAATTGEM